VSGGGAAIAAEGLSKSYRRAGALPFGGRKVEVVSDVSFTVGPGEVLGLVGANGSGKTTTLGLLVGLVRPTRGRSRLLGLDPSSREVRRTLGFLPEAGGVEPLATPRESLALRAAMQGLPRAAADEALERFGLGPVASRQLRRCSQGTVRRTALAQAALGEPRLLFLDEPSSGLDADASALLSAIVAEAKARGASVVLTSHVALAGIDLCDRLVVLDAGRAALAGTRAELLDEPGVVEARIGGLDPPAIEASVRAAGGRLESARTARRDVSFLLREAERRSGRR
jgi:Cu-processing system ATP-binding protein